MIFLFKCWLSSHESCTLAAGGVTQPSCPYKCVSDKYRMPKCYTPLEELLYTFGGPWPFAILLSCILGILALLLSTLRIKFVGTCSYQRGGSIEQHSHHQLPYLLSLSEVYTSITSFFMPFFLSETILLTCRIFDLFMCFFSVNNNNLGAGNQS